MRYRDREGDVWEAEERARLRLEVLSSGESAQGGLVLERPETEYRYGPRVPEHPTDRITGYPDHYIVNGDTSSCACVPHQMEALTTQLRALAEALESLGVAVQAVRDTVMTLRTLEDSR